MHGNSWPHQPRVHVAPQEGHHLAQEQQPYGRPPMNQSGFMELLEYSGPDVGNYSHSNEYPNYHFEG